MGGEHGRDEMQRAYRSSREAALRSASWTVFGAATALTVLVTAGMVRARSVFLPMFLDMDLSLSDATEFALSPWFFAVLPGLVVLSLLKELLVRRGAVRLGLNGVYLFLVLATGWWHLARLSQPLFDLMTAMGE